MQETLVQFLGFPCGSAGNKSACNVGDLGLTPGLGRSPGEGKGYPLQHSGLENSTDCKVHGVTESDTTEQLSLSFHFHYAILAWLVRLLQTYPYLWASQVGQW